MEEALEYSRFIHNSNKDNTYTYTINKERKNFAFIKIFSIIEKEEKINYDSLLYFTVHYIAIISLLMTELDTGT